MGPNWANLPPAPGRRNLRCQATLHQPHPLWYSCSITIIFSRRFHQYYVRATHNSLQLKINLNITQYSAVKLKQTRLTWNAKTKTKMLSKAETDTCLEHL